MRTVKGTYSTIKTKSANAIPVRIMLIGLDLMSLWVRTKMFTKLKTIPTRQMIIANHPWI